MVIYLISMERATNTRDDEHQKRPTSHTPKIELRRFGGGDGFALVG